MNHACNKQEYRRTIAACYSTGEANMMRITSRKGERGQSLPLLALSLVALIGLVGFGIDVGRIYAARTELTRALDAGALAGVQELPNMNNARSVAESYVFYNMPDAENIEALQEGSSSRLRVTATKRIDMSFLHLVGVGEVTVRQSAVAGLGTVPMDVVMAIDRTGSMGYPFDAACNQSSNNNGCPIVEARQAANALVDVLLAGSTNDNTLVGMAPFNWCWGTGECTPNSWVTNLTSNSTTLHNRINNLTPSSYTNVCEGLRQANAVLFGAGAHASPPAFKAIVLLSDGANTGSDDNTNSSCRGNPTGQTANECPGVSSGYSIDPKTNELAVEIFVVGLGLCSPASDKNSLCNPSMLGTSNTRRARNTLKCISSSLPGSNDHYFETDDPTQLTQIFENIARLLALRLLE
jgi:Flp pilus assembly protein TadG